MDENEHMEENSRTGKVLLLEPVWKKSPIIWEVIRCGTCGARADRGDNYCRACGQRFTGIADLREASRRELECGGEQGTTET